MLIGGFQKLSLLDYPDRTCCTIFTTGCNYRCPYCHNAALITESPETIRIPKQEILTFLEKRTGLLDGVCITGGEPLLQQDLDEMIREIRSMGFLVKLDTNGSSPDKLAGLIRDGLIDYVAMDIKNAPNLYPQTIGRSDYDMDPVKESVRLLLSDCVPYEFRTTVAKPLHSPEGMQKLGEWINGASRYFIQNFEDSGNILSAGMSGFNREELNQLLERVRICVPSAGIRGL